MNSPTAHAPRAAATDPRKILASVFGDNFARNFQDGFVLLRDQQIRSSTAKRFYDKDFAYLSRQMHFEAQYRSWYGFNTEILDRYAAIINTKLGQIQIAQTNWLNRLQRLLTDKGKMGDEGLAMFANEERHDVPIIASQARVYFDVLKQLDDVYTLSQSAYLWGIFDSAQAAQQQWFCKKAVRAFRVVLQTEAVKVFREATRLQNEHRGKDTENPKMASLVEAQARDVKQFTEAAQAEDRADGDKPPVDPGQAIEEAARIAQAANTAGKKSRTPKKEKPAAEAGAGTAVETVPAAEAGAPPAAEVVGT